MVMAASLALLFYLPHKINLPGRTTSRFSRSTVAGLGWGWWSRLWLRRRFSGNGAAQTEDVLPDLNRRTGYCPQPRGVFLFTYPANRQTLNWARLPDNWPELRQQWEYSPAAAAGLYVVAVIALSLSLLVERTE